MSISSMSCSRLRSYLLILFFSSAFLVRLNMLRNPQVTKLLSDRIEISTPLSSWKRAVEGITLHQRSINPYDGDSFHESPLSLYLYKAINLIQPANIAYVFTLCDIFTAFILSHAAYKFVKDLGKRESVSSVYKKNAPVLFLKADESEIAPCYVAIVYLYCPYSLLSCVGMSTTVFFNFLLSLFIWSTAHGRWFVGSMLLAAISYHSLYHISLLVAFLMCVAKDNEFTFRRVNCKRKVISIAFVFFATLSFLLYLSYKLTGSWQFLESTYGFTLSVPDLTPNIGLFWYFFTEMFEHFRVFFLCTFQLNAFIYTVPLAIRLRREPMLLLCTHFILIALFKSYPCIGDVAFYFSLIPFWHHLFPLMRQTFWVGCIFSSCSLLAPTLWHLWIYSGSANANFYFAITLVFNTGQIFLLMDFLSAYIKREYYLLNGIKADKDGKLLLLRLQ